MTLPSTVPVTLVGPDGPAPAVTVVVVTHNASTWVARCLGTLLGEGAPERPFEVVVVDSASTEPEMPGVLDALPPEVLVVRLADNVGFGRACNLAVRRARGDDVVLLNPDALLAPGSLDALLDFLAEDPVRGLVGGRAVDPDGTLDPGSCFGLPSLWSLTCFATGLSTVFAGSTTFDPESLGRWQRDSPREVGMVTGCLLAVPHALWERLGGFDERYFMYGEDADLARRARALGHRPAVTPDALVVHANGASSSTSSDKKVLLMRGRVTYAVTAWAGWRQRYAVGMLLAGTALRALLRPRSPWAGGWARRTEWRGGYPPLEAKVSR